MAFFRITRTSLLLLGSLSLSTACLKDLAFASASEEDVKVAIKTPQGPVVGVQLEHGQAFYGLPFAAPPVGSLRWAPPRPAGAWTTPRDATKGGPRCPQAADPTGISGPPTEATVAGSEDCLYLNVFRPTPTAAGVADAPLPVMVWIHGGAFVNGSGIAYDASLFAQRHGVVVVTINYRLGALGFLAHPSLNDGDRLAGNYGLLDQVAALQWVQNQIAAYHGDPAKVTIFGESAGGFSVCALLVTPQAKPLFHGAIIQSGPCGDNDEPRAATVQSSVQFGADLGCLAGRDAEGCLRGISSARLVVAAAYSSNHWGPTPGDAVVPKTARRAFADGTYNKVPTMIGTTHDENRLFALLGSYRQPVLTADSYTRQIKGRYGANADAVLEAYPPGMYATPRLVSAAITTDAGTACPSYRFSQKLAMSAPVYTFEFNDPHAITSLRLTADVPDLGAYHSSEITYLFQRKWLIGDPGTFTAAQQELADRMGAYWSQFAKTGDPNAPSLPLWSKDQADARFVMSLAPEATQAAADFAGDHHCDLWR